MSDILDDARETLAGPGVATGWLIAEMIREIERLRLTDAERVAVEEAIQAGQFDSDVFDCEWARKHANTLRGLLERTQ